MKYEASIKAGKFLLIAHGTADEVQHARNILQNSGQSRSTYIIPSLRVLASPEPKERVMSSNGSHGLCASVAFQENTLDRWNRST